jgi:hypothetical protein
MPPVVNAYDASLAQAACDLASAWHTADVMGIGAAPPAAATPHDLEGWGCAQASALLGRQRAERVCVLPCQGVALC